LKVQIEKSMPYDVASGRAGLGDLPLIQAFSAPQHPIMGI